MTAASAQDAGLFAIRSQPQRLVGRPLSLDYERALVLTCDAWKARVGGIPHGTLLLACYADPAGGGAQDICLLLRCLRPAGLPTDGEATATLLELYKDRDREQAAAGGRAQVDDFTRHNLSFSALECRILGTFYHDAAGQLAFGADLENFYSAHYYAVYKPEGRILEDIVNFRPASTAGGRCDVRIGVVRYSSSRAFQESMPDAPVRIMMQDILGRRTALFGMTRTGKSNTVKILIDATTQISRQVPAAADMQEENTAPGAFTPDGLPRRRVGQIIFDINGEYANANAQDEGAISDKYQELTDRFSTTAKPGFELLRLDFYRQVREGFALIASMLESEGKANSNYIRSFLSVDLGGDGGNEDAGSGRVRAQRLLAAYQCCLYKAGFEQKNLSVRFTGAREINAAAGVEINARGATPIAEAARWFEWVAANQDHEFFRKYREVKGHDWADADLRAILTLLAGRGNQSGYRILEPLRRFHSFGRDDYFVDAIVRNLRQGRIEIIDLSQGDPLLQQTFCEDICEAIFRDAMARFTANRSNNFIQFYFEEAHNLFPKKEDQDLSQIYNRIAKEGAKLSLGMIYATQEVSSISSNILKNTQNWFISHLNNEDEIREIRKYYDFDDFCSDLLRYSAGNDQGFIRMKTYSNSFVIPVQVDKFTAG